MTDTTKPIVAQLVSPYCAPNRDPASAGRLRSAFVAHTMFFHEAHQQAVQIDRLVASGIDDEDALVTLLCESYSRAVFESLFALHFDRADPQADLQLSESIRQAFGAEIEQRVVSAVRERGVLVERRATRDGQ